MSGADLVPDARFGAPTRLQGESGSKRGGGNWLLLYGEGESQGLLKVYRSRGSARRERFKRIGLSRLEGKRGVTPRERQQLERRNLELWRSHGFDVPALLDRPVPDAFADEPALWLEYCPGPTLWDVVCDASLPFEARREALARGASDLGRRQELALSMAERDLVMKHGSLKHVLVFGDRQVSIDLEGGYVPTLPMLDALADELAGFVRSLRKAVPEEELDAMGLAFPEGYGDPARLHTIAGHGIAARGLARHVKRWNDRRRRGRGAKVEGLRWLQQRNPVRA